MGGISKYANRSIESKSPLRYTKKEAFQPNAFTRWEKCALYEMAHGKEITQKSVSDLVGEKVKNSQWVAFLTKCHTNGVLLYEDDDARPYRYGIIEKVKVCNFLKEGSNEIV